MLRIEMSENEICFSLNDLTYVKDEVIEIVWEINEHKELIQYSKNIIRDDVEKKNKQRRILEELNISFHDTQLEQKHSAYW